MMTTLQEFSSQNCEIIELGHMLDTGVPSAHMNTRFSHEYLNVPETGVRSSSLSVVTDRVALGCHTGTHIDAPGHIVDLRLHPLRTRGVEPVTPGLGVEDIPPILCGGTLFDIADHLQTDALQPGFPIDAELLSTIADSQHLDLTHHGVAVIRTGWSKYWHDPTTYFGIDGDVPGITLDAAGWLLHQGFRHLAADNPGIEVLDKETGLTQLPVHRLALERRVTHIESLNLENLHRTSRKMFTFICLPLRIVGGTGSPVRPVAVVPRLVE